MGNVQGYVKIKDKNDSSMHLIKVNKLHKLRNGEWADKWVYDLHKNEFGKVEDGKFIKKSIVNIPGIGDCYSFNKKGKIELYVKEWFLQELRDAAVKYIENSIASGKSSEDDQLINL